VRTVGYQDLLARMLKEHVLFSVLLELTYHCNLNCFFCYNDEHLDGQPLVSEDYSRLLAELARMQVVQIILSGGEPLTSPAFWPAGRQARELGFITRVKTNAHALSGAVARRLKAEIDPFLVEISLHGAGAETHDRQTRSSGSFERLMENVPAIVEAGLRIRLHAILTRWNEHEIEAMFALADELGVALAVDPVLTPRDDGDRGPFEIAASREAVARLYRILDERRATADCPQAEPTATEPTAHCGISCSAGAATLAIDPFGTFILAFSGGVRWAIFIGNRLVKSGRNRPLSPRCARSTRRRESGSIVCRWAGSWVFVSGWRRS